MDQDRVAFLLAKFVAGELTPEEEEELEWNKLANPRLQEAIRALQSLRELPPAGLSPADEQEMLERGLQQWRVKAGARYQGMKAMPWLDKTEEAGQEEEAGGKAGTEDRRGRGEGWSEGEGWDEGEVGYRRRLAGRKWMVAAGLLVVAVVAMVVARQAKPVARLAVLRSRTKEVATKFGTRVFQELPDGSKLWLNAGSKATYNDSFPDGKRELTLTGEAFFDIKHDPKNPFVIHAGKLDVRVLGTTLDVKAYPGDSTIETTLIKGKVEIDVKGRPGGPIVLRPSEKVSIPAYEQLSVAAGTAIHHKVQPDSSYGTIIETSWVEDKLVFRNERMAEVASRLERWYNIRIRFENEKYQQQMLTGFFKDQPVENVMKALQLILGFQYTIQKDTIHIR